MNKFTIINKKILKLYEENLKDGELILPVYDRLIVDGEIYKISIVPNSKDFDIKITFRGNV